jgi:hypothetical protein
VGRGNRGEEKTTHEEFNDPYSTPNIIRVNIPTKTKWAGHVARMGEKISAYRVLVETPEGKSPLERPTYKVDY